MAHNTDKDVINSIKTAKGQLDGFLKMVEDDRYCIDISKQIFAVQSLLKKANMKILRNHIDHCVKSAVHEGKGNEKMDEIFYILGKYIDKS